MTFMSSNSPMSRAVGVVAAGYDPAAPPTTGVVHWFMDGAEIQRKRDALRSELAVIEEACRRLEEAQAQHAAGERHLDIVPGASTAAEFSDDFYPLDDEEEVEEGEVRTTMHWHDQVCRQMVYTSSGHRHHHQQQRQQHDDIIAIAGSDHDVINLDDDDDDDIDGEDEISRDIVVLGLHIPHIINHNSGTGTGTSTGDEDPAYGGGGFGAVPASAAAIAGLGRQRYDGDGDGTCVICMREYRKGRTRLRVMPCAHRHRFHGRCIRKWLSRSNACPLCRHALPTATAADEQQGGGGRGGGVHRRAVVRVNVNPY